MMGWHCWYAQGNPGSSEASVITTQVSGSMQIKSPFRKKDIWTSCLRGGQARLLLGDNFIQLSKCTFTPRRASTTHTVAQDVQDPLQIIPQPSICVWIEKNRKYSYFGKVTIKSKFLSWIANQNQYLSLLWNGGFFCGTQIKSSSTIEILMGRRISSSGSPP